MSTNEGTVAVPTTIAEFFDAKNEALSKQMYSLKYQDSGEDLAILEKFAAGFEQLANWESELLYPAALTRDMNKFSTAVRNIREEVKTIKEHLKGAIEALRFGDLGGAHKHHHHLKNEFTEHNGKKEFALYMEFEDFPPEVVSAILAKVNADASLG